MFDTITMSVDIDEMGVVNIGVFHRNTLVATESNVVYKLKPKSYDLQVQDLIMDKNFKLALQIVVSIN